MYSDKEKGERFMKLKKSIKKLVTIVFVMLLVSLGGLSDFELSIRGIITLLVLLVSFGLSGMILVIDNERRWNEIFK